jgi:hypothetical protein
MGTSPFGVATRVSAEAQSQLGQPTGQVPFTGSWQPVTTAPRDTSQQSCPTPQQTVPQQFSPGQALSLQGGVPQVP